jgi:hypothetical protein
MVDVQRLGGMRVHLGAPGDVVRRNGVALELQAGKTARISAIEIRHRLVDDGCWNCILEDHVAILHPETQPVGLRRGDGAGFLFPLDDVGRVRRIGPQAAEW